MQRQNVMVTLWFAAAMTLISLSGEWGRDSLLQGQTSKLPAELHSILERESEVQPKPSSANGNDEGMDRNVNHQSQGESRRKLELDDTQKPVEVPPQSTTFEETLPAPLPEPLSGNPPPAELSSNPRARIAWPTLPTNLGYEVLLASPVHEALISITELTRQPRQGELVPVAPPQEIDESFAAQVPAETLGTNESEADSPSPEQPGRGDWIAGYWAWLPESQRYVWVTGVRRVAPPGRVWISGKWSSTTAGYRWTVGYWGEPDDVGDNRLPQDSKATSGQLALSEAVLPAPPAARNSAPLTLPPNADSFWLPGHWAPRDDWQKMAANEDVYQWREGYWTQHVNHWIWQPARLVATEEGYRYVSGFWDYEPQDRGQGYAAIVPSKESLENPNFSFVPIFPLSRAPSLLLHLFIQVDRIQLFYGDCYDDAFVELGYRPWYLKDLRLANVPSREAEAVSEPLWDYYQWKFSSAGVDFAASMARYAQHFRAAPSIRPAAQIAARPKLAEQEGLAGQVNANDFDEIVMGRVSGRPPLTLDGSSYSNEIVANGRASTSPSSARQQNELGRTTLRQAAKPESVTQASASTQNDGISGAASRASNSLVPNRSTVQENASSALAPVPLPPPGAAAIGQRGRAALLVLPGGRIVLAAPALVPPPIAIGPRGVLGPPGLRLPPPPFSGLRGRFGRR